MSTSQLDEASLFHFFGQIANLLQEPTNSQQETNVNMGGLFLTQFFVSCANTIKKKEEYKGIIDDLTSELRTLNDDSVLREQVKLLKDELAKERQQNNNIKDDLKMQEEAYLILEREKASAEEILRCQKEIIDRYRQCMDSNQADMTGESTRQRHGHGLSLSLRRAVSRSSSSVAGIQQSQPSSTSIPDISVELRTRKRRIVDFEADDNHDDDYFDENTYTLIAGCYATPSYSSYRREIIRSTPIVSNVPLIDTMKVFTRAILYKALGGKNTVIARLPNRRTCFAIDSEVWCLLCPLRTLNPWCPVAPGHSGYVFLGFGMDSDEFNDKEPKTYTLFIGSGNAKPQAFMYFGTYTATRVDELSKEEWNSLSPETQRALVKMTHTKGRHIRPQELKRMDGYYPKYSDKPFRPKKLSYCQMDRCTEDIENDYDTGKLKVPCVKLTCLDFDHALYEGLTQKFASASPLRSEQCSRKKHRTCCNESE